MGEAWYVRIGNEAVGPRAREELEDMRSRGDLEPSTLVWREGMAAWATYVDSGLAAPQPPPLPPAPAPAPVIAPRAPDLPLAWREPMDRRALVPPRMMLDHMSGPGVPGMPKLAVGDDGWQVTTPAPWRRYFGRMFDITLVGSSIWLAIGFAVGSLDPALHDRLFGANSLVNNLAVSAILTCIIVTPVLALLIGLTGTSPGKWIFGTRITRLDGRPIGFRDALARECEVLVFGLAFGIPLVLLFTLIASKSSLSNDDVTRWDARKPWVVTHREQNSLQVILCVVGAIAWVAARMALYAIAVK